MADSNTDNILILAESRDRARTHVEKVVYLLECLHEIQSKPEQIDTRSSPGNGISGADCEHN